jgi:hypothetical protein
MGVVVLLICWLLLVLIMFAATVALEGAPFEGA